MDGMMDDWMDRMMDDLDRMMNDWMDRMMND